MASGVLDLNSAPSLSNLPDGSVVKNLPVMQETWAHFLPGEDPLG